MEHTSDLKWHMKITDRLSSTKHSYKKNEENKIVYNERSHRKYASMKILELH